MTSSIGTKIIQFKRYFFSSFKGLKKNKRLHLTAFSLIELLIVIVIIGSLLSLSLPQFRNTFNNLKFDNFCQDLISRMKYLQERATVEQTTYRLNLDLSKRIINIEFKEEDSQQFTEARGLLARKIRIPDGIEVETEETNILFYPDSSIDGSDIEILGEQNKAIIQIKESIGRIDLQKINE